MNSIGCMDFLLKTKDKNYIVGRTNEFAVNFEYSAILSPRGFQVQSNGVKTKKGLSWKNKYGYIGISSSGMNAIMDGMNEKGLSFGYLWLPETEYENEIAKKKPEKLIDYQILGNWILGNFANVDEVKKGLEDVYVFGKFFPKLMETPPLHVSVHDASGKSIVIEFLNGEKKIYDNPLGIITNSPTFDWHLTNLKNYVNLSPDNAKELKLDELKITPTGQGSGMLGLPGDITPSSRFVRLAFYKSFVKKPKNVVEGLNTVKHIINSFDIPLGVARIKKNNDGFGDFTTYALIKDLNNKVFYFRTYNNINYKKIDLSKVDFSVKTEKTTPLDVEDVIVDVTDTLE